MTGINRLFADKTECLQAMRDGLKMWAVEGRMVFDRPTPIRRMCTATLRGLAGTRLLNESPDLFHAAFKPVGTVALPPAYLFQTDLDRHAVSEELPFRLITWDPGHRLMEGLMFALAGCSGAVYGESGSRVLRCTWDVPKRRPFTGLRSTESAYRLQLKSPLQLRINRRILPEQELSQGHLVSGAIRRINLMSQTYGNGLTIPEESFLTQAAMARETRRSLREVLPMRRSCTQENTISLRGITGSMTFLGLRPLLADLLSVAETLHMGRHTAEGCGHIRIYPLRTPNENR